MPAAASGRSVADAVGPRGGFSGLFQDQILLMTDVARCNSPGFKRVLAFALAAGAVGFSASGRNVWLRGSGHAEVDSLHTLTLK